MTLKISNVSALAACDAIVDKIDLGADVAKLIIYDGEAPATLDDAITTQLPLVSFDLPNPCFGDAADANPGATATANPVTQVAAAADGEATFFRILDRDGNAVMQGDVSAVGGGGDLELSSTNVVSGIDVVVVSLSATMPEA